MRRFILSLTWLFIAFVLSFSAHAVESDDDSLISSSPPMDIKLTYSEKVKPPAQGRWKRKAEKIPTMEGNWYVEWHDSPEEGQVERAALTLAKPWEMKNEKTRSGAVRWVYYRKHKDKWSLGGWWGKNYGEGYASIDPTVSGNNKITIDHPYYILGHWGGDSVVQLAGPNKIMGKWKYRDKGGTEIWTKAIPKITRVKFLSEIENEVVYGTVPGRVENTYSGYVWKDWNDMRGNRPRFWIEIYGENLWGDHAIDLCGAEGLEPREYSYIRDAASNLPGGVVGIKFTVIIWPHFKLGRKTIFVDGMKIPFVFILKNYPWPGRASLTVSIIPQLKKVGIRTHYAQLKVNSHDVQIPDSFDEETKTILKKEAESFVEELKDWAKFLSKMEHANLVSNGKLVVDVKKPYRVLRAFKGEQLKIPLYWKWPEIKEPEKTVELAFVTQGKADFYDITRIPRGEPFWVEAEFFEAPKEDKKIVTMSWGDQKMNVKVSRTNELSTLYRSGPFIVNPLEEELKTTQ